MVPTNQDLVEKRVQSSLSWVWSRRECLPFVMSGFNLGVCH